MKKISDTGTTAYHAPKIGSEKNAKLISDALLMSLIHRLTARYEMLEKFPQYKKEKCKGMSLEERNLGIRM